MDTLDGGAGNDTLDGLEDDDILNGNGGDDRFIGGPGADEHNGGTGTDEIRYYSSTGPVTVDMSDPTGASNTGDAAGDTFNSVERIILSFYDDTYVGSNDVGAYNWAAACSGNDSFTAGGAGTVNQFNGSYGDDDFTGGAGTMNARGGTGNDTVTRRVGPRYVLWRWRR
jgi:Ca2+-binding RTX toxin-like protein